MLHHYFFNWTSVLVHENLSIMTFISESDNHFMKLISMILYFVYSQNLYSSKTKLPVVYVMYVCNMGRNHLPEHEPKGTQFPRASVDISGKSQPHMLHMYVT